jgi:hypothetical protein
VVDKVAEGHVTSKQLGFPLSIIILPMLSTQPSPRVNFGLQYQFYNSESGSLFGKKVKGKAVPVRGHEGP